MGKYSELEMIVRRQSEDIRHLKMGMKELIEEKDNLWAAIKLLAKETGVYKPGEELKKKEEEHRALERDLKMKEVEAHNNQVITEAIVNS